MASKTALVPVRESGWRMGFANLFRKENGEWWRTRSWLVQALIFTAIINGILLAALNAPRSAGETIAEQLFDPVVEGVMIFVVMSAIASTIGAIIVMQDAIIDEKRQGTAAWVLSKPVSRIAFVLAKLLANSIALILIMVVLQGVLAYIQIAAIGGNLPFSGLLAGMALLALHLLFYITLTLMLGTFFNARGPVIGIPMALIFGYQFIVGLVPQIMQVMPWGLAFPLSGPNQDTLIAAALRGDPLPTVSPIIATTVWIVIFVVLAFWRFQREEF